MPIAEEYRGIVAKFHKEHLMPFYRLSLTEILRLGKWSGLKREGI